MEYLDTFDEEKNFIGTYDRKYVHENALWHNTVHCWLFDMEGNIYFQKRKDEGTFYTTSSGHVITGETVKQAFRREIKEEIGIDVKYEDAILINIVTFKLDKIKKDGSVFKDRAFANVFIYNFKGNIDDFNFDINEVAGLGKMKAIDILNLFKKKEEEIKASIIYAVNSKIISEVKQVSLKDFLVNEKETALQKYGEVLEKIIEITK